MFKKISLLCSLILCVISLSLAQTKVPDDVIATIKSRVDKGTNYSIVVGVIDASGTTYYSYG